MTLVDSIAIFLISALIGGLGIHFAAVILDYESSLAKGFMTAVIGAVVWAVVSFFLGGIPLLGPLLTFLAWLWVINSRYPGGWFDAAVMALFAWIMTAVILYVMAFFGVGGFEALGIPRL